MRISPLFLALAVSGAVLVGLPSPAAAHVTIPDSAEKGGFSIVTFSVPNERPDAGTTSVEVKLPEDHPLSFVSVQPKPGWTATTTMRTLDDPVDAFGREVTEVVDTVTWTGGQIEPGQFDTFAISVGPLPTDTDELVFPTIQTYSSGEEVPWIELQRAGAEEPEHPAPVLELVDPVEGDEAAAPGEEDAGDGDEGGTDGLAVAALVASLAACVFSGGALIATRRRTT